MSEPTPKPARDDYDERVYRKGHPPHRTRTALILIALLVVGTYFALTKSNPLSSPYELNATFDNAANIRQDSPVRIAGVNVGKVTEVRSVGENAEVTFTVDEDGLPIHTDAQASIRPRIFLEGNFFIDLRPGSPSAPDIDDGGSIPLAQTSTAVQLDQILTTLQAPDRESLQKLLQGYGTALNAKPTAAEDRGQDPDVQGESGAQAINDSFEYAPAAGRDSAIVAEALQGTEAHDLSRLIAAQADVFGALQDREEQLKDLVTNLNVTTGAFAAESESLSESVRLLAPTLEVARPSLLHTDQTLPFLRAFARDVQPGLRELPATITASGPFLNQTRRLLGKNELAFIADQLRRAAPGAGAATSDGKGLFQQIDLLSNCVGDVLLPTGDVVLSDTGTGVAAPFTPFNFETGVPNFKEFMYAATGLAGETQNFDGNGPYIRFQTGGGGVDVEGPQPNGGFRNDTLFSNTVAPPQGTRPQRGPEPLYNTGFACQNNPVPDLNGSPLVTPLAPPSPVVP